VQPQMTAPDLAAIVESSAPMMLGLDIGALVEGADFKDRAFDAGAAFMITKPFTADDFTRCLAPFS